MSAARSSRVVEAVVGGGQPFLPRQHDLAAVLVVGFARPAECKVLLCYW